ncbi:MAG: Gfo/Idh/MocA family oxidoreductase [Bacteroidetes bacterium]|nr:Gfo/Idh/MocA family oxidoreductase [Bacteroidota bacterium]
MTELKFAIVGCGRIAERHAEHIVKQAKLVAVCDTKEDRRNLFSEKYGCKTYNTIDELLANEKDLDLIAICSPNGLHAEHTIKSLRAGINVLCEKPMAINVADCQTMIREAEKANKHLFIVKQNRFNAPISALKNVIDEGRLGNIINVQLNCFWNRNDKYYESSDWKGKKDLDGGTLFTQFSHFIDLLYWMVGDIKKYHAITRNYLHQHNVEFDDSGAIIMEFENGAIGSVNYTVNSYDKNMEGSITIFGEKGTVKVGGQYLNVLEYQSIKDYTMNVPIETKPANDYGFYQGSMSNHDKVYENIMDVLTNNGRVATNGFEGLKTVQIIENIYNLAQSNT